MHRRPWLKRASLILLSFMISLPVTALGRSKIVLDVQPLYQADYPDILFEYAGEGRSVQSSGCGAVCASMVLSFLLPELEQTPESLLTWAYEQGLYEGKGLSIAAMQRMLEEHGLVWERLGPAIKQLQVALGAGRPVIAYMGKGIFTQTGHYVIICGVDQTDQLLVIDPNSRSLSMRWYPSKTIFNQMGSSAGFLICDVPTIPFTTIDFITAFS